MKILVACEESQRVCIAFRNKGHEAFSCDIQACSGSHPEWHIQDDVLKVINLGCWDMMIGFPPCTYLSRAATSKLYPNGLLNLERYEKGLKAKDFFLKLLNAPIDKICLENPVQFKIFNLPPWSQEIQPWEFGEPYTKKTRLWLKNLPYLMPTLLVIPGTSWTLVQHTGKNRSKTFLGVAAAMAQQWG